MRALCCALIKAWLKSSCDWLMLLALAVNHWNFISWLAGFDVFPYTPIFPHPTPFKSSGENAHRSLFCGPLGECEKKRKQNKMAARQLLDSVDLGVRLSTVSAPSIFVINNWSSSLRIYLFSSSVQSICTRIRQVILGHSALSPNSSVSFVSPQVQSSFLPPVFGHFVICLCLFCR